MAIRHGVKIGFTGAGGTGKTTDATVIAEKLDIPMMKSASRQVYEQLKINEVQVAKFTPDKKWELQESIFRLKTLSDDEAYQFVADRTLLDHWAYCLLYCASFIPNDKFMEFETLVRKHMRSTYTHIFYFPWGFWEPEKDDVRQDLKSWQSAVDSIITGYCVRWNLPVIQVPQVNGQEFRQEYILKKVIGEE